MGTVIEWEGYSKLTVTEIDQNKLLKMNMYLPKVSQNTSVYDVNYKYTLAENKGMTILNFEIGDFSPLPNAQNYVDASLEFVQAAKQKIKVLAEQ